LLIKIGESAEWVGRGRASEIAAIIHEGLERAWGEIGTRDNRARTTDEESNGESPLPRALELFRAAEANTHFEAVTLDGHHVGFDITESARAA
jgi:hypothetical protein